VARKTTTIECKKCGTINVLENWQYRKRKYKELCSKCAIQTARIDYQNNLTVLERNELRDKIRKGTKEWHKTRSQEERTRIAKYARSCVKTSGVELRRKQQEFIDNAGPEYYEKYCEKRKKISLDFHASMTDNEKIKHYTKIFKKGSSSKARKDFLQVLSEHDIELEPEYPIKGFFVDAKISETNTIVEFYGDVFHCNPSKFTDPKQYCSWISRTVEEQWKRDERREAALKRNGYKVIVVWESVWNARKSEIIQEIKDEMYKNRNG